MDSRIIDVTIGLVLVFALTSLLVATLVEALSTILKKRGSVLKQAIESFLGDDNNLMTALFKEPLLVSLAQGKKNDDRKPSYIGADVMITSLLAYVTRNYAAGVRPSSPAELVAAVKFPKAADTSTEPFAPLNGEFQKGLESLVHGVENDWQGYEKRLQAWYDSVAQRSSGWYKRWSNIYLFAVGFLVALAGNIDPIVIGPRLWNDAALREVVVAAGEQASKQYAQPSPSTSGTPAEAPAAPPAAPGATAPAAAAAAAPAPPPPGPLIAQPLPRRVTETRAVSHYYYLLEQSISDAIEAARSNPKDDTASLRQQILTNMRALPGQLNTTRLPDDGTAAFVDKLEKATIAVDKTLATLKALIPADTATDTSYHAARDYLSQLEASVAKERDALSKMKASLKRDRDCAAVDDPEAKQLCMRMSDLTQLRDAGLPIGWSPPAWPDIVHKASDAKCFADAAQAGDNDAKQCDHTLHPLNFLAAVGGWLVTAIAATLGAPFWFDLLGRLVKLRGSGTRINGDSAKGGDGDQPASTMSTSTTPAADTSPQREPMSDALNDQEKALSQSDLEAIQRVLQKFGGAVTGAFDAVTRDAIKRWQQARNTDVTGELTPSQIAELLDLSQGGDDNAG